MKNVGIIIQIDPRQAVVKGSVHHGEIEHTLTKEDFLTLTKEELEIISKMPMKGDFFNPYAYITANSGYTYGPELPLVGDCSPESISAIVNGWDEERENIILKDEQRIKDETQEWIEKSLTGGEHYWLRTDREGVTTARMPDVSNKINRSTIDANPRIAAKFEEMKQLAKEKTERRAELEKRNAESRAVTKLKEEEQEKALLKAEADRTDQLAAWVMAKGTDNQKKRLARNVLPESEILDGIRNEIFSGVNLPLFEKISDSEVQAAYGNEWGDAVVYDTWTSTEMSAEEFDLIEKVEEALKKYDTTMELIAHRGRLKSASAAEDEEYQVIRKSLKVTVKVGQVTVGCRFAV